MILGSDSSKALERSINRKRLKQKKILLEFEKELKKLDLNIKYNLENIRTMVKRGCGYSLQSIRLVGPYMVAPAIVTALLVKFEFLPFFSNGVKYYRYIKTTTDNLGNVSLEKQMDAFDNNDDYIEYLGEWKSVDDGNFLREVYVYDVEKYDIEKIMTAIDNPTMSYLTEIFGDYDICKEEISNNISDEEKNLEPSVRTVVFTMDKDDYEVKEFTILQSIVILLAALVVIGTVDFYVWRFRDEASSYVFGYEIRCIKEKNPIQSKEYYQRKRDILVDNINKLRGEE